MLCDWLNILQFANKEVELINIFRLLIMSDWLSIFLQFFKSRCSWRVTLLVSGVQHNDSIDEYIMMSLLYHVIFLFPNPHEKLFKFNYKPPFSYRDK